MLPRIGEFRNRYPNMQLVISSGDRLVDLVQHWLAVNDAENYVTCALQGCGLIQLPRFHVEDYLHEEKLVEVLAGWQAPGVPVYAFYPQHRQHSPRVRVFIDWVSALYQEKFGSPPAQ